MQCRGYVCSRAASRRHGGCRRINKVKVIKRRAYGLPTFTGFRKRVVIACG